ncbi:FapA family protein [Natranaerofaba carboxydovora]|uniref:FapA family protein n=1 Tax=Natranaerofaba carboxydovora TaxID=2742683 RepID=UPI001F12A4F6|nr:FapA family protein [Natranaerofaba carboxydovora]UMZ73389.1 Flagellar Assembly Protein A [Natranaerofaba carboxydovora]
MTTKSLPRKYQGKTVKEALENAKKNLGIDNIEDLEYKVLDKGGKSGGLIIKKKKPAVVEVISIKNSETAEQEKEESSSDSQEASLDNLSEQEVKALDKGIDGYFNIEETQDDKVFLTVHPPENEGKKVKWMDVKKYLENYGYEIKQEEPLVETVRKSNGEKINITDFVEEIRIDGSFEVRVEEKNMKAILRVELPQGKGKKVTFQELTDYLKERGIIHGINNEAIKEAIDKGTKGDYIVIAEGTEPEKGKDAEINVHFEKKEAKPVLKEDGTVDYYNVENVTNVSEGDLLATRIPPEEGVPGTDVYGEEVPPQPPKDKLLKKGKNTILDEENDVLKAEIDGQVVLNNDGTIHVFPVYEVSGDLDLSVGNIDFVGNVVVKGAVKSNLSIKAEGDVEIGKSADNCFIEAKGNIYVRGGIQGKSKGVIKSKGQIVCKFIENANVIADGDVTVSEAIMHSNVKGKNVYVTQGKRGLLVGGRIVASEEVHAKIVGSNLATATTIEVGLNPDLREKIDYLRDEYSKANENLDKTKKAVNILEKLEQTQGKLPPDKESMLLRLQRTEKHLTEKIEEIENEKEELERELEENTDGKVKVQDTAYPGVKIVISNVVRNNDDTRKKVTFYLNDEGEIRAE